MTPSIEQITIRPKSESLVPARGHTFESSTHCEPAHPQETQDPAALREAFVGPHEVFGVVRPCPVKVLRRGQRQGPEGIPGSERSLGTGNGHEVRVVGAGAPNVGRSRGMD